MLIVWIIISIIIVGATTALMLKFGLDWNRDRATHWGHEHMEEVGHEDDKEDKDASR